MRLLATLVVLLAVIYLHLGGVQTEDNKINFFSYNNGLTPRTIAYSTLLGEIRSRLANGTNHEIAVTRNPTKIPLGERFVQVQLQNGVGNVITLIIDTENVYVLGYLQGSTLHYLDEIPQEVFQVFPKPQYTPSKLGFNGNYVSLGNRETQELGHAALNGAIDNFFYGRSQRSGMLVIIQMVAEAVRILYIEQRILRSMYADKGLGENFLPDPMVISMENKWSKLSEQIQRSGDSGVFPTPIEIINVTNQPVLIKSVEDVWQKAALGLMLYDDRKSNPAPKAIIRMPLVAADDEQQSPYGEPTTNIIGRDGQCMAVRDNQYHNGNAIILWACGNNAQQRNQLWTFKSDGTIRSNGKCLTTYGYAPGNYIMIYDCDTAVREATRWVLHNAGTIMNPTSGLVIAAETSTQGTVLTVAQDNNSSMQAWSAGIYTQPARN